MVKKAEINDLDIVTSLMLGLWDTNDYDDLEGEARAILMDENTAIFLCSKDNKYIGFAQCQLRFDYVEGTESSPVGYLEGIYVDKQYRMQGVVKQLIEYCELWAKKQNCSEFGSDCELDNIESYKLVTKFNDIGINVDISAKRNSYSPFCCGVKYQLNYE